MSIVFAILNMMKL